MLCSLMLTEFTKTLKRLHEEEGWIPGQEFDVLTVSFSGTEMPDLAARAKDRFVDQLGLEEAAAGWHFLTGTDESIAELAESVGFSFRWMANTQEYAHPAALMFLSPDGVITRYIHGMAYETRDVKLAVVEASEGRVGTAMDRIFLYCYRYDPLANSYVLEAWALMRTGGLLTVFLLGLGLFFYWRRENRTLTPGLTA
jgi:protein SCO1/2